LCVFTHVAAGALAGALSPSPYLAPVFGLVSHVLLDIVPHYDFENMKLEIALAVIVFVILGMGGAYSTAILLGAIFGMLPDFENLLWKLGKISNDQKLFPGHVRIVPHGRTAGIWNLIFQFAATAVMIVYLIRRGA
jgi:hypothetical protein